jgi:hypothetical protein
MVKITEQKTAADQLRECHDRCAKAMTTLAIANEILQCRQDMAPRLLEMLVDVKANIDAAHGAVLTFSDMLQPIKGRA